MEQLEKIITDLIRFYGSQTGQELTKEQEVWFIESLNRLRQIARPNEAFMIRTLYHE